MADVGGVTALPVVDLRSQPGPLRDGLREAAHEVGFFYLTGHGVPAGLASVGPPHLQGRGCPARPAAA